MVLREFHVDAALIPERLPEMSAVQFGESARTAFPRLLTVVVADSPEVSSLRQAVTHRKIFSYVKPDAAIDEIHLALELAVQHSRLIEDHARTTGALKQASDERDRVMDLFKRYVPEQVVSTGLRGGQDDLLLGEVRVASVLFADIRGFTELSRRISPSDLVAFLNDFWAALTAPVFGNGGSVNKFIGDGMLAIFGAPISHLDNQGNAVRAALAMMDALNSFNQRNRARFGGDIRIGIGINTGLVVVGNVGTHEHMEYSVIGDAVNVADRIQGRTRELPDSILVSESTWYPVSDLFEAEEVAPLELPGRQESIRLFRVIGRLDPKVEPLIPESAASTGFSRGLPRAAISGESSHPRIVR